MLTTDLTRHKLSKSTFMKGCQCSKSLWLYKYQPELKEEISAQQQALFKQGHSVGELAQELFPGGIDVTPESYYDYQKSVALTAELIKAGKTIIYEAAFQYDGVMAALDILVKKRGKWYGYEVKSSTKVKPQFVMDSALQYHVIAKAGLELAEFNIVHLNNQYMRVGELNVKELFTIEPIIEQIKELQPEIEAKIVELKAILTLKTAPNIKIGDQCGDPYDCDFIGYCWKDVPHLSVYELNIDIEAKRKLIKDGIMLMKDLPDDYPLSKKDLKRVDAFKTGKTYIDKESIKGFVDSLTYPLHFLDFETIMPAIPLFDNTKSYMQLPTQFSLHRRNKPGTESEHFEFLAEAGIDPRRSFIEALIRQLGEKGTILVFSHFENTRLNAIIQEFPEYEEKVNAIQERIIDLIVPFRKGYYYSPAMNGSNSIKDVLPALVPELGYENLVIADGMTAVAAFQSLSYETDEKIIQQTRQQLLEYCKMDTLAMVKILEVLEKQV